MISDEASGQGVRVQLRPTSLFEDVPDPLLRPDPLAAAGAGAAGGPDPVATEDAVISRSDRAASYLAASLGDTSIFGLVAIGVAASLADFVAPAIVDGIENDLARSAAAAGFAGIFLGLTGSVTTALGKEIAVQITQNRIQVPEPEGDVGLGAQLWSAVKNQTVPALGGFGAAFVTANALDAGTNTMGDTNLNWVTLLAKGGVDWLEVLCMGSRWRLRGICRSISWSQTSQTAVSTIHVTCSSR